MHTHTHVQMAGMIFPWVGAVYEQCSRAEPDQRRNTPISVNHMAPTAVCVWCIAILCIAKWGNRIASKKKNNRPQQQQPATPHSMLAGRMQINAKIEAEQSIECAGNGVCVLCVRVWCLNESVFGKHRNPVLWGCFTHFSANVAHDASGRMRFSCGSPHTHTIFPPTGIGAVRIDFE